MFKRIKNLLDISRYTVDDLRSEMRVQPGETLEKYYERTWGPVEEAHTVDVPRPAQIINMKAEDPFKELEDDTTK